MGRDMRPLRQRMFTAMLVCGALVAMAPTAPAQALSLYTQPQYAAFLADADTGEILYSRQADEQRFPASITKVMTLYLVFEQLESGKLKLDDRVTMSRLAASQQPSKLGLPAGGSISVDQAIRSLATKSANDVAVALAEKISGNVGDFAELMTTRAHQLGMRNSYFVNPNGLPDSRHVSTARDIFLLSQATIRHFPQYYSYYQQKEFHFGKQVLVNHNNLLKTMPGVDGIKTGFTNAAGFTLSASAVRDGRRLVAVVLGGPSSKARDGNVESLLNAGFEVLEARRSGQQLAVADLLAEPGDLNDQVLERLVEQGRGSSPRPTASTTASR